MKVSRKQMARARRAQLHAYRIRAKTMSEIVAELQCEVRDLRAQVEAHKHVNQRLRAHTREDLARILA